MTLADESNQPGQPVLAPAPPIGFAPLTPRQAVRHTVLLFAACVITMQIIGGLIGAMILLLSPTEWTTLQQQTQNGGIDVQSVTSIDFAGPAIVIGSIIGEALGICCFFALRGKKLVTTDITTTVPVGRRWGQLGLAVLLVFTVQLVVSGVAGLVALTGYDPSKVQSNMLDPIMGTPWGILAVVLLLPFFEELIFRGAILRHLAPFGVNFAIVTQAVLFGLWHLNLYQGLFAVPMGLILGYVAYHFSLKWSFALHALNNGFAVASSAAGMPGWAPWAVMVLATLAAVVVLIIHRQQIKPTLSAGSPLPPPGSQTPGHLFKVAWASPAFIVVTAIMFVICVLMTLP